MAVTPKTAPEMKRTLAISASVFARCRSERRMVCLVKSPTVVVVSVLWVLAADAPKMAPAIRQPPAAPPTHQAPVGTRWSHERGGGGGLAASATTAVAGSAGAGSRGTGRTTGSGAGGGT